MKESNAREKKWKSYRITVNGLPQEVRYNEDTVEELFLPFLRHLTALHQKHRQNIIAFLAAPPATGKSTLLQFLEQLSRQRDDITEIQALGMDGFHYPNSYLETHFTERDGKSLPLKAIKGAPETFDAAGLQAKIRALREGETVWPVYDRRIHDVLPNGIQVRGRILLIEGNWLLLKAPGWQELRCLADYTLRIHASPELLKNRLIRRKIQGGLSEEEATRFYETSDSLNVERFRKDSAPSDAVWRIEFDGDFIKQE